MKISLQIIKIFVCKQGKSLFQQMTLSDKKGKKLDCLTDYICMSKRHIPEGEILPAEQMGSIVLRPDIFLQILY